MPKLTFAERWILHNQYEILERLDPNRVELYRQIRNVLCSGYEDEYSWAAQGIHLDEDVLDPDIAAETRDILQMFSEMKLAYDELEDKEGVDTTLLAFWGFDANTSDDHLRYARFLTDKGEYEDVRVFNSGRITIGTYQVMLKAWKRLPLDRRGLQMRKEDLQSILDAP